MSEVKKSSFIISFLINTHLVQTDLGHPLLNQVHGVLAAAILFSLLFFEIPAAVLGALAVITLFSLIYSSLLFFGTFMLVAIGTWSVFFKPDDRSTLKLGLFAAYFLAMFHKLNSDFFNPLVSCSTHVLEIFPSLIKLKSVPTITAALPWLAILTEGFMAFGLLSKRLVPYALITAMLFHAFMLGANIFTMALNLLPLAVAFLHLPDLRTEQLIQKIYTIFLLPFIVRKLGWAFNVDLFDFFYSDQVLQVSSALILLGFAFVFYQNRKCCEPFSFSEHFKTLKGKFIFSYLLFWGAQPYLGLNTMQSFTMGSNLRTETNSNHLFMSHIPQIFSLQNDLVSYDEYLQIMADCEDKVMVKKPLQKSFEQSGVIPYGQFSSIPRFEVETLHLICRHQNQGWRKYFQFRPIDEPNQCRN